MTQSQHSRIKGLALGLVAFLMHSQAFADMRCGTNLVSEGESTFEVKKKCGEPANREVIPAALNYPKSKGNHAVTVENWVYGPQNGAYYRLKFLDGTLVSIKFSR